MFSKETHFSYESLFSSWSSNRGLRTETRRISFYIFFFFFGHYGSLTKLNTSFIFNYMCMCVCVFVSCVYECVRVRVFSLTKIWKRCKRILMIIYRYACRIIMYFKTLQHIFLSYVYNLYRFTTIYNVYFIHCSMSVDSVILFFIKFSKTWFLHNMIIIWDIHFFYKFNFTLLLNTFLLFIAIHI